MFGRLAMESGLVTHEDIVSCLEEQASLRADGIQPPKLGELLVERGIVTEAEVDNILRMQSNPSGLIGRQLVEKGLVTRDQLRAVLDEQSEYLRDGLTPPRLGDMVVEKGLVTRHDLDQLFKKKEAPGSLFGEFLVSSRLVKQEDIKRCLELQKAAVERGEKPQKLGELLVACGTLRKDQMEMYSRRHLQARRMAAPALPAQPVRRGPANKQRMMGDYELLEKLGQHVDGVTHKVLHRPAGAVLVGHFFNAPTPRPELDEKRSLLPLIRSPAMQLVFGYEEIQGRHALFAQYIEGTTLEAVVSEKGSIDWVWATEMIREIGQTLVSAENSGLHHGDIRPGSILVDTNGRAKLALWHYTADPIANRDWLAQRHRPLPCYFAPEQVAGKAPTAASDIFSLGLTMIMALTGNAPLRCNSVAESASYNSSEALKDLVIDMDLPLGLISIISKMVERELKHRYKSLGELLGELDLFMQDEGVDLDQERHAFIEGLTMDRTEADAALSRFLQTEITGRDDRSASIFKLARYYVGPFVAMIIIMLGITAVYKITQASHGMMVRANWLDQQGDKQGALNLYRIISGFYPNDERVQRRYFDLGMELKEHGEAEIALERLMALHPDDRQSFVEMQADLQVWQRRFLSAVDLYREALRNKPGSLELRIKIADALLWANNYAEAESEFKELVVTEPNNNSILLGLARSAAGAGDLDTAMDAFDRLFRMDLLTEANLMEYAWLLRDRAQDDKLRELSRTALSRSDSMDYSRRNLTNLYYWAGDFENTAKMLDSLADVSVDDKDFLHFRIDVNNQLGNTDAVLRDYKRLAELEPGNPEPLVTVARLYQGKGDFTNADVFFRQALSRDESDADIRRAVAENLGFAGDRAEEIRWYKDILTRNPNDREATANLVNALLWNEDYAEAQEYVERLYRDNPNDVTNRINLALVYSRLGRENETLPLVDKLLAEGALSSDMQDRIALNAMVSNSNRLLLRLVGAEGAGQADRLAEMRLMLARRLRGEGHHATALPLYAAVLAAMPEPDATLLMEMAETAGWAGRHDIATRWLELAADVVSRRGSVLADGSPKRLLITRQEWDQILEPLKGQRSVYDSLAGFKQLYGQGQDGAVPQADKYF